MRERERGTEGKREKIEAGKISLQFRETFQAKFRYKSNCKLASSVGATRDRGARNRERGRADIGERGGETFSHRVGRIRFPSRIG